MTLQAAPLKIVLGASIATVDAALWDSLEHEGVPFLKHAFLAALESSGAVGAGTGWTPRPLCLYEDERLVGAVPLYEKSHSYGEFVFDFAWAHAYHEHGLAYYPKLVAATPFTPARGPRRHPRSRRPAADKVIVTRRDGRGVGNISVAPRQVFCNRLA